MTYLEFTNKDIDSVLTLLKTKESGLSPAEAQKRLHDYGPNQLSVREIHWWHIFGRQFKSPFTYLLFFSVGLSFFLKEITDGVIILIFIAINAILGFVQEFHSEKSLKLLASYIVPEARVLRKGVRERINSSELVPGDILLLEAGDVISADVRFISVQGLAVDESILTGESAPVTKMATELSAAKNELSSALNIGFSGTHVVSGEGVGVVVTTGKNTEIGEISRLTIETKPVSSFEIGINKFSRFILLMISIILLILFLVNILIKGSSANIPELLLFSIALAVGVVPEALPVVTTIAFSRGAVRLAKHKVVVKRLSAIEDLGSIEILCTDKTGTLTENSLTVKEVYSTDEKECLKLAVLASASFEEKKRDANNAFDLALLKKITSADKQKLAKVLRLSELPFDPERKRNSVLINYENSETLVVRGAPETIISLCPELDKSRVLELKQWLKNEGLSGRRVIAVATKKVTLKDKFYDARLEAGLAFQGMISFVDPIKKTTGQAIERAKKMGIMVKILTGDNREVAGAVAKEIGLTTQIDDVITGEELFGESLENQKKLVEKYHVFARVSPEQKYKIIELLRAQKEVGYLGEGINDGPALKMAHVGIVVNGASAIAKDAADIVLLQNSLLVIIDGIKEGREIFSNIIKYIKLTLISNFGNFYAVATAALILSFLPMLPIQILLLNLLSDFPMIMISTDKVDIEELRRPKTYNIREVILIALILGIVSTIFDFIFFAVFRNSLPPVMQTYWFMGSVLTELVLIFSVRTRRVFFKARPVSFWLCVVIFVATFITVFLPFTNFGRNVFGFIYPSLNYLGLVFGIVILYFVSTEIIKLLYYRLTNRDGFSARSM
jgi:Mg2+-importing ATPase